MDKYTVWVGGIEATQYYVSKSEAERIATEYKSEGYTDVIIEKV